jgi:steroid 5-alpha reductase family enzyme
MSDIQLLLLGWLAASLLMLLVWIWQYFRGDAGVVDVAWGLGVALLAVVFLSVNAPGLWERRLLAGICISLWAVRLSGYVAWRIVNAHEEDGRYRDLKAQHGAKAQAVLFRFFQLQAFGCWLFALPLWLVAKNAAPWSWADGVAIAVWLAAVWGETQADAQLAAFRREPHQRGTVCRRGWWRYSRHPNYFFEWLHWWTYVFLAWHAPWGALALLGPLAMGYFICYVTGIPPTEAQALRSRGEAYREYQRTTSPFIPWWPKSLPREAESPQH